MSERNCRCKESGRLRSCAPKCKRVPGLYLGCPQGLARCVRLPAGAGDRLADPAAGRRRGRPSSSKSRAPQTPRSLVGSRSRLQRLPGENAPPVSPRGTAASCCRGQSPAAVQRGQRECWKPRARPSFLMAGKLPSAPPPLKLTCTAIVFKGKWTMRSQTGAMFDTVKGWRP